jgi:hypothetical protein
MASKIPEFVFGDLTGHVNANGFIELEVLGHRIVVTDMEAKELRVWLAEVLIEKAKAKRPR